eukprot:4936672-Lingulodinium_polyedra.AAC.1
MPVDKDTQSQLGTTPDVRDSGGCHGMLGSRESELEPAMVSRCVEAVDKGVPGRRSSKWSRYQIGLPGPKLTKEGCLRHGCQ